MGNVVGGITHTAQSALPGVNVGAASVDSLFGANAGKLEGLLADYLPQQRWFTGKQHGIESARFDGLFAVPEAGSAEGASPAGYVAMADVTLSDGGHRKYAMPLVVRPAGEADGLHAPLARVHAADGEFVIADGSADLRLVNGVVDAMRGTDLVTDGAGGAGHLAASSGAALSDAIGGARRVVSVDALSRDTTNSSSVATLDDGRKVVVKFYRGHEGEVDPSVPSVALDVHTGAYLTDVAKFWKTPPTFGSLNHMSAEGTKRTVGSVTDFVENDGDGWTHALRKVDDVLTRAATGGPSADGVADGTKAYARVAGNHGTGLAELHRALSSGSVESGFTPVKATADDVQAVSDSLRADASGAIEELTKSKAKLTNGWTIDQLRTRLDDRVRQITSSLTPAALGDRIHTHGDFHLGQLLAKGDDAYIVDLEGAPRLSLAERWARKGALSDVARQLSSYEYAAATGIKELQERGVTGPELEAARAAADQFAAQAKQSFLDSWSASAGKASFVPTDLKRALELEELSNALYEVLYESGSRPDMVSIPLGRLERLLAG